MREFILLLGIFPLSLAYEVRQIRGISVSNEPFTLRPFKPIIESESSFTSDLPYEGLQNLDYMIYVGDVLVGTPGQYMTVIYDTGSSNTLLTSTKAGKSYKTDRYYDSSKSSSYFDGVVNFTITYGSGPESGVLARDSFKFTDSNAITNHYFMEILSDGAGNRHSFA